MRASLGSAASIMAAALALTSGAAIGQIDGLPLPELPEPTAGTGAARFAIAALKPGDSQLTLITAERDCGDFSDQPWTATQVAESVADVVIRLEMARMPDGTACEGDQQVRVPVELASPVGERTIRNGGSAEKEPVLVNRVDGIDTGFRYHCGGASARVVDLLGPGLEVPEGGPPPGIDGARAILETGDSVEYLGPFRKNGKADVETWGYQDGTWQFWGSGTCQSLVDIGPGRHGATWRLRGQRLGADTRRLKIWVRAQPCHGTPPPANQITRPIVQVRKDSIVIIVGTFFPNQLPSELIGTGASDGYAFIDCNGFGPSRYVVDLPVALGDRKLYDGGVFPPRERGVGR